MTEHPLISIIIPVYNLANYIVRTVKSILCQTYKHYEIVIVNDGSTDSSGLILDRLEAEYPSIIRVFHIPNGGVTKARLYGVSQAKGEWIGFVDGDDTIEPDMYEILVTKAMKSGADISHCGYRMLFNDGREKLFYGTQKTYVFTKNEALKELLCGEIIEPGLCNKLYSKRVFEKFCQSEKMNYEVKNNEDLLMNFLLFSESQKSVFCDVCKYNYIIRNDSASRSKINIHKIHDPIIVKEAIIDLAPKDVKETAIKVYIGTCVNVYNSLVLSKSKEFKCELGTIRNKIKERKKFLYLLSKKTKLLVSVILWLPCLYKPMYSIYSKWFQEKKYE